MTVADTRKCLYEVRNRWKTSHVDKIMYFSDVMEEAPVALRPLTIESFALRFVEGQAIKRDKDKRVHTDST